MERKQLYAKVKELNLQDKIKSVCGGKNYTQVSNELLEKFVNEAIKDSKKDLVEEILSPDSPDPSTINCDECKCNDSKVDKLIKVLRSKRILLDSEVKKIMG